MARNFRDLPGPVQDLLREQIDTAISMTEATGLPILECRKMVLASGGHQELLDTIERCVREGLT